MIYCLPYHVNFVFVSLYLYLYLDNFVLASWYLCICILISLVSLTRSKVDVWVHLIRSQSVVKGATHLMLCTSVAYNVNLWKKIHQKHWKNYVIWASRLRNLKNCLMGNSFSALRDASNVCTCLLYFFSISVFVSRYICIHFLISLYLYFDI